MIPPESVLRLHSPISAGCAPSLHQAARPIASGSIAAATGKPKPRYIGSQSFEYVTTSQRWLMSANAEKTERATGRFSGASSDTLSAKYLFTCAGRKDLQSLLDKYRSLNASVETFLKSLKAELIWRHSWPTRRQAEAAIFQYINGFYNTRRRHSYLGGISPIAFEARVA